jgi:hypothetical protein
MVCRDTDGYLVVFTVRDLSRSPDPRVPRRCRAVVRARYGPHGQLRPLAQHQTRAADRHASKRLLACHALQRHVTSPGLPAARPNQLAEHLTALDTPPRSALTSLRTPRR